MHEVHLRVCAFEVILVHVDQLVADVLQIERRCRLGIEDRRTEEVCYVG